ncbi:hypothetical protein HOY80DRAFT_1016142 [Tuber brumale]|nr:hypothetical protein HOY80DRAFT_1016142 [Tuber brumale]
MSARAVEMAFSTAVVVMGGFPPAITVKPPVEEYVRQLREKYGDYFPTGLQEASEYRIYNRAEEEGGGDGDGGEGPRDDGSPSAFPTHLLTYIGRFASSRTAHATLGGPHRQFSLTYARKRSKHQFTIPLNQISSHMSGKDADVFIAAVMPALHLRKRLGGDWVLGGNGGSCVLRMCLMWGVGVLSKRKGSCYLAPIGKLCRRRGKGMGWRRFQSSWMILRLFLECRIPISKTYTTCRAPAMEKNKAQARNLTDLIIATNRLLPIVKFFFRRLRVIEQLWLRLNLNGGVLLVIERGTPLGFDAITYARSTILKDYIKDVDEAFQSLSTINAYGSAKKHPIEKGLDAIISLCMNQQCSVTHGTQRKHYCCFSRRYERPGYLQRFMEESSKNHEALEYSYVAFRGGVDHRTGTKNKISPTIAEFGINPVDGEPDTPVQSPYTASQLYSYTLTLPHIILPPIEYDRHAILDACTPTGSIERWVVPKSLVKSEFGDARKRGWGDLWVLGAESGAGRTMGIGDGNTRLKRELIAIEDPYGDGVMAIVKDKTAALLKALEKETKEGKLEARERNTEMEKAMAERKAREMRGEMVWMRREGKERERGEM